MRPSGAKATEKTVSVWPRRVATSRRRPASHSRTVWSVSAVASRLPSGLYWACHTSVNGRAVSAGPARFHSTTDWSKPAVASRAPS